MKLKTIYYFLMTMMIIALSGCFFKSDPENVYILKYTDKEVVNVSESYTVQDASVPLYHYLEDDSVSLVDLEEFSDFLGSGIIYYNVSKDDELTFVLRQSVPEDVYDVVGVEYIDYEVVFNHEENTITTSDFGVFDRLNLVFSVPINDVISLSNIERSEEGAAMEIDLDDYNFDIQYENDHYYMPFYLANLFLTGASVNMYETDDMIIVFDYGTDIELLKQQYTSGSLTLAEIQEPTNNYLALYFDYFYGLKEEKEIDSFDQYFATYDLDSPNNYIDYFETINNALIGLDDLHTRVMDPGYLLEGHIFNEEFQAGSKVDLYSEAYAENKCRLLNDTFEYIDIDGTTHLYQISRFESNTGTKFKETMDAIAAGDNVVIDLTCNTGGSLQGVVELMMYLTDQEVPVRNIRLKTGQISEEHYYSEETPLQDYNLYVITSNVTYSAANVFASMVRDLEIGTIIGDHTLGGSSALLFTVLPNGMVISNSSYMTFLDENMEINEDGFDVDLDYILPYDYESLPEDLTSPYRMATDFRVETYDLFTRSVVALLVNQQDEDILVSDYTLNVYDTADNLVFTQVYADPFLERTNFGGSVYNFDIEIIVDYDFEGESYQQVIFFQEGLN